MIKSLNMSFTILRWLKIRNVETISQIFKNSFCTNTLIRSELKTTGLENLEDDIDLKSEIALLDKDEKSVLADTNENVSDFTKFLSPTFSCAPLVNKSVTLKNLVQLGVNLHALEKKSGIMETILTMDFDTDIKKYITFLSDYVEPSDLGLFITKNPGIFKESIDDMLVRINYLESKRFDPSMIKRVVSYNPFWLSFSTLRIDRRLGHFQKEFSLSGQDVRMLATRQPRLITYNMHHIKENTFSIREEMGFGKYELKTLLLSVPRIWMMNNKSLMGRFNYIHNTMNIPHEIISKMPGVFYCRQSKLRQRHTFLKKLGRDQFDFTKPNYVSLLNLVEGTDIEFCNKFAKCNVADYNLYLKSQ